MEMEAALKRDVLPVLRAKGFKGTFPHFRRIGKSAIDLLTFQFDKQGGAFVIEIARSPLEGIVTHWGQVIPAGKVKAWDVHPDRRRRIKTADGHSTESWFRFDAKPTDRIIALVCERLASDGLWKDLEVTRT